MGEEQIHFFHENGFHVIQNYVNVQVKMEIIIANGVVSVYNRGTCIYDRSLKDAYNQTFFIAEIIRIYKDELSVSEDRLATVSEVERKHLEKYVIPCEKQRVETYVFLSTHVDAIVLAYENYMKQK